MTAPYSIDLRERALARKATPYATSDPFGLGNPNLLQRAFTFGVQALRQPVEDVGARAPSRSRERRRQRQPAEQQTGRGA